MIDLLLEDAPDCVTENFGPVESSQANRWRWALGARQTLRFKPPPAGGRVHFEISLPAESSRLILSLAGLELRRFAGKEKYSGYFDLPASGEAWAEVSFVSAAWNESRNRFAPDDRPLAFSISRFTLVERDPEFSLEQMKRVVEGGVAPPALCSVPFTHFYINEGGTSYPCCELVLDVCTNEDEFGGTKVRSKDDLPKAWNSPLHRSLRRSMLSGREPAVCRACYQSEKAGANSLRKMLSGRLPEAMLAAKEMGEDGSLPLTPQVLDFRLGNTCNLKCRMCSPGFSAGLVPEFSELTGKDFSAFRHVDWHKRPGFLSEVAEFCSTIRELRIMGGEPFVTPEFPQFLQELINQGTAPRIDLVITTNGTRMSEAILSLFPRFHSVSFEVSLEGVGAVNDYIRYPSNFAEIERNLQFLHANLERFNVRAVRVNTTVQIYNLLALPDLFRYLAATFPKFNPVPYLIILKFPQYFSVQALPAAGKERARERLEDFLESVRGTAYFGETEKSLRGVIGYLFAEDKSDLMADYEAVTQFFDRKRGQECPTDSAGAPGYRLS